MPGFLPCSSWQVALFSRLSTCNTRGDAGSLSHHNPSRNSNFFSVGARCLSILWVGPTYRLSLLGVFTAPLMATFVAIGLLSGAVSQTPSLPSSPVDPWLETHASLSLISYGAFALAFVAATMFLIQDRLLKSKSLNQLFYNLPPVCYLANAVRRLVVVGFLLLTIGIAAAFFIREFPGWWKIVLASSVWIAYGSLLIS